MIYFANDLNQIIQRLTKVNIDEEQAEAIAYEIKSALNNSRAEEYLKIKMSELTAIMDKKLEKVKSELLKWFIGVGLFQTTALIISIFLTLAGR